MVRKDEYNDGYHAPSSVINSSSIRLNKTYLGPYLTSEEQAIPDNTATIGKVLFTFDDQFRHSKITIQDSAGNSSYAPKLSYDLDGLLVQAGELAIERNATGQISKKEIGKSQVLYSHDSDYGELARIEYRYNGKSGLLHDFKRDALGRISEIYNQSGRQQFHYDVAGRFTGRSQQGTTKPYSQFIFDKNGNRVRGHEDDRTFTASYDDQDRLLKYNQTSYRYNQNGDRESEVTDSVTTNFEYDAYGNLTSVEKPDLTINYQVDGENRRIAKLHGSIIVTRYVWLDQLRIGAELNWDGTLRKTFVYGDGVNSPEYMVYQGKRYLFVKDHRGSVNMVVDVASGEVKQKLMYSEFGEILQDTNPGFQPFGFAGGLYDYETKLVRFGARDYDGRTGRWLSKDPIRFAGGDNNLYAYILNDPINSVDYYGKKGLDWLILAVGGAIALYLAQKLFIDPIFLGKPLWPEAKGAENPPMPQEPKLAGPTCTPSSQ